MKIAIIRPLYKTNDKQQIPNYRQITLQPQISKICYLFIGREFWFQRGIFQWLAGSLISLMSRRCYPSVAVIAEVSVLSVIVISAFFLRRLVISRRL